MTRAKDESRTDEALDDAAQGVSETSDESDDDGSEIDAIGAAAGLLDSEGRPFRGVEKVDARDDHRWELEPDSAEDHPPRRPRA
jgi:hypothetical protein